MTLSKAQASTILTRLDFRVDTTARYNQAIENFQLGWNLGDALNPDGVKGSKTDAALLKSEARRVRGLGTASANFSFLEVRCKCDGRYADCQRIWTKRSVFARLESSRAKFGRPITVTSGCRCPNYNAKIGGAKSSQHLLGLAIDWAGPDKDTTRSWRLWNGIGYGSSTDRSLHTDLRPSATPSSPVTWVYPGA